MDRSVRGTRGVGTECAAVVRVSTCMLCVVILTLAVFGTGTLLPAPALAADGPRAIAYSPPADALDISPVLPIWVKFTTAIDLATLTADTFYLTPLGSSAKVPATLTYVAVNRAVLTAMTPLTNGVTYQATVTVGIKDMSGNPLQSPWSWTFTIAAATPPDTFVDMHPGDPYYAAIQGLYEADIVSGDDGPLGPEFRPNNPVWRQQFAKMICGVLDLTVTEDMTSPFTDLDDDDPSKLYPNEYVAAAYANGITTGTTATTFDPYLDISRAQVVTMVVRALQSRDPTLLSPPAIGFTNTWGASFSPVHGPNARVAEANGLLDGLPLTGAANNPWASMSRGEVAQVLWNALQMLMP